MSNQIVGFVGRAGAGKTTAARGLRDVLGYRTIKFADPLKDMLRAMGLDDRHIEGDLKETPCDLLCGKTPRLAMQTLGTEWGRDTLGQDVWVRAWQSRVALKQCGVVADDVRFPNEVAAIKDLGGAVIRVVRPNGSVHGTYLSEHASERLGDNLACDAVVVNDSTPDRLIERVLGVIA